MQPQSGSCWVGAQGASGFPTSEGRDTPQAVPKPPKAEPGGGVHPPPGPCLATPGDISSCPL